MPLPEDYDSLTLDDVVELAITAIKEDGVFWLSLTRTPSESISSAVKQRMPEASLYLHSPPPDWDHVIIDTAKLPGWPIWMGDHAVARSQMKERGVPYHKLPPLPKGVYAEDPDDDE